MGQIDHPHHPKDNGKSQTDQRKIGDPVKDLKRKRKKQVHERLR